MAGLGYRAFSSGEVLTAANLQGYAVDQSVMVFASAAARTSALPSPSQGMVTYLTDSGTYWVYSAAYNSSTNPGGALASGHYPLTGSALFYGTATKSTTTSATETLGAAGFSYTELTDTLGWHSPSTNPDRITPTVAGLYRVTGTVQWSAGATGDRRISVFKNGSLYFEQRVGTGTGVYNNVSLVIGMNGSSDYFYVTCFQSSGGASTATAQIAVEFVKPTTA